MTINDSHTYFDQQGVYQSTSHLEKSKPELAYQFSPHFHPYVGELVHELIEGGVSGLQAIDTQYHTLIKLKDAVAIEEGLSIQKDEILILAEGTVVEYQTRKVRLSLDKLVNCQSGLTENLPESGEVEIKLFERTVADLPPEQIKLKKLKSREVTLNKSVNAILIYRKPTPIFYEPIFSTKDYDPVKQKPAQGEVPVYVDESSSPVKDLDFGSLGAYSVYNWELFYHVPLTVAMHLSKNQRFAEAQQWFHYIFDPTDNSNGPTPERFWKVKPFQTTEIKRIEEILATLAIGDDPELQGQIDKELDEKSKKQLDETIKNIEDSVKNWKENPFRPHVVARKRQTAYMYKTVMAYLDNLIAWGDSLFRQDTGESINEAMQFYVLAANILGPRPQAIPKRTSVRPQTYHSIRHSLDEFSQTLTKAETLVPFVQGPMPGSVTNTDALSLLSSLDKILYFCVPRNDKILTYWDTVGDRLFKIRNSLNIQGIFRQLLLFEPPIDPGLLAKAVAAGVDITSVVSGLNQPLPLVRFQVLVQKATEICQEVKSLGNNLLSAIEKEDNEALAILRAKHERIILGMAETVRYAQWQEAIKSREGLEKSLANAFQRYIYYERQLGKEAGEISIPILRDLDTGSLEKLKLEASEPEVDLRPIEVNIAKSLSSEAGGKKISSYEAGEMSKLQKARDEQKDVAVKEKIGAGLAILPELRTESKPWGIGFSIAMVASRSMSFWASFARANSDELTYEANQNKTIASYDRREQEWAYQSNLIAGEITQIYKQLRAAQIREAISEREWKNHQQQIRHAEEIEYFLTGEKNPDWTQKIDPKESKKTNKAFYAWMKREVKGLYSEVFKFAFDIAKKAERALQHELGDPQRSYLQFNYLTGNEGLLAGEKLYLDLKRMEMAYHDLNQREYELTKHVSLLQVNPVALLELRATGRCTVTLPEELFDMDCPSHYFRRIKSVALTIPCVSGPYTSVNCTLTLQKSSIRKNTLAGEDYARSGAEDDRFSDYFGSVQSIVTSSAQNDSGMFETNLRDERYLPFEGSGVISEWQLQLPNDPSTQEPCQFDYNTISDVIVHLRYTAREGGKLLRDSSVANITTKIKEANASGLSRLFSLKHDFSAEWHQFVTQKADDFKATVKKSYFPFFAQGKTINIDKVELFTILGKAPNPETLINQPVSFDQEDEFELSIPKDKVNKQAQVFVLSIPKDKVNKQAQVFVIFHYSIQ